MLLLLLRWIHQLQGRFESTRLVACGDFPPLHILIESINHVRQPCRASCLTRGQQTVRNEPTTGESHWKQETCWDSSWNFREWPSMWGRTMNANVGLSNSVVYPWNYLVLSAFNFLLDCNWSLILLFSIHVCDAAVCKLPPTETLHIVSLTTFPPHVFSWMNVIL